MDSLMAAANISSSVCSETGLLGTGSEIYGKNTLAVVY